MVQKMVRMGRLAVPIAFLVLLCGCASDSQDAYFNGSGRDANVYVAPVPSDIAKVAIMPFRAPTELIGSSVSDLFVTEMLRAGRYELVERSQMAKVLSETELSMAGVSESKAVEIGSMVGADGVIIGTVDEYSAVAQRGKTYPTVGISVRLIDCRTGKVMWSADLAQRADSASTTLPQHARSVVHELTAGLYQRWTVQKKVKRVEAALPKPTPAAPAPETRKAVAPSPEDLPPAAPQDFATSDMGLREIVLNWSEPAANAYQYRIERAPGKDGPFGLLETVSAGKRQFKDRGTREEPLKDNTTYYYRLIAISKAGLVSPPSPIKESLTAPPPDPPVSVRAEMPAARAAKIVWGGSSSEGVVRYRVERTCDAEPGPFVQVAELDGNVFYEGGKPDSPLKDSTKYYYRILAVNRVGAVGNPSKPVEVVTRPPPTPVWNFKAGNREVRCVPLSWDASGEEDVVRYDLYRADAPGAVFQRLASLKGRENTTYLDGGKDPGTLEDNREYRYSIRAINSVMSESADPEIVTIVTRAPPPAVTGLKSVADRPREVPLTWEMSPDEKVIGYEIYRTEEGDTASVLVATVEGREATSYIDRGKNKKSSGLGTLNDGRSYKHEILAFNTAKACSPLSAPAIATTKRVPATPLGLTASQRLPRTVTLQWKPNPEKDIETYVVEGADSATGRFREVTRAPATTEGGLTATDRNVPDGVQRYYRVKAVDRDTLESLWSETAEGATKPVPNAPTDLKIEAGNEGGLILRWAPPPQPDVKEYRIWKEGFLKWEAIATAAEPTVAIPADKLGKKATLAVTAVDGDGLESLRSKDIAFDGSKQPLKKTTE
jgi:fibronectin type 3 domain-containing protein/TolB-like protein